MADRDTLPLLHLGYVRVVRTCRDCSSLFEVDVPGSEAAAQAEDCDGDDEDLREDVCADCADEEEEDFWQAVDDHYAEHGYDAEPEELARLLGDPDGDDDCDDDCDDDLVADPPAQAEPDSDYDGAPCRCKPPNCSDCGSQLQGWTCDGDEGVGACWEHGTRYAYQHDDDTPEDCDGVPDVVEERPPGWCDRCSPDPCECNWEPDTSDPDNDSRIPGVPWCQNCGEQGHATCCWGH